MADNVISNPTYNLMAIMLSKLEGLEVYDTYLEEAQGEERQLIEQIQRDDQRHAEMIRDALEKRIREGGLR